MNNEQRTEIIKSLAMGMSAEKIAGLEDVPVSEVEKIRDTSAAEIAERKKFYGYDENN